MVTKVTVLSALIGVKKEIEQEREVWRLALIIIFFFKFMCFLC